MYFNILAVVKRGDFKDCRLYGGTAVTGSTDVFILVDHSQLPTAGKDLIDWDESNSDKFWRFFGFKATFEDRKAALNYMKKNTVCQISADTVEKYEIVSENQEAPSGAAFLRGSLIAGPTLGIAAAMASASKDASVAVYMKNGKKFILYFDETQNYGLDMFLKAIYKL